MLTTVSQQRAACNLGECGKFGGRALARRPSATSASLFDSHRLTLSSQLHLSLALPPPSPPSTSFCSAFANAPSLSPPLQVNGTTYPELSILQIFHGTLLAVRAMHQYVPSASSNRRPAATGPTMGGGGSSYPPPEGSSLDLASGSSTQPRGGIRSEGETTEDEQDDEEESVMRGEGEGEALIGGLEGALAEEEGGVAGMGEDGGVVLGRLGSRGDTGKAREGEVVPWAHRDIKPVSLCY